jgi:hypothetical protein
MPARVDFEAEIMIGSILATSTLHQYLSLIKLEVSTTMNILSTYFCIIEHSYSCARLYPDFIQVQ